ncbi:M3 family metallopeptidase [bacterium]|nr:M3 family metallopeptidase [bacterium]
MKVKSGKKIMQCLLRISIFAILVVLGESAAVQTEFQPIPEDLKSRYHFDLRHLFFPDEAAVKAEESKYNATVGRLTDLKGKATSSAKNLLNTLQLYDEALVDYIKLDTYWFLRSAINTRDEVSDQQTSKIESEFSEKTAFVQTELVAVEKGNLEAFVQQQPELEKYKFAIESFSRLQPHILSLKEEEILGSIDPSVTGWQFGLYRQIISSTKFADIQSGGRTLNVRTQRADIANDPDRQIREQGFLKLYEGYASQRNLYAYALIQTVNAKNTVAHLRNFEDSSAQIYFNSFWTKQEVGDLLEHVAAAADLYKRYQKLRADYVGKKKSNPDVAYWDLTGTSIENVPHFTIIQATDSIEHALIPLGPEYSKELDSLLDPANGRMDIVKGENRKSGGFSKGFPGVPTMFFAGGFEGYYNDVRVLTHESTHAIHRQLMKNNQVLPVYAEGPHFLFESFAIFNELLLPEFLYKQEKDPEKRRYFLEQFFEGKGMALFSVAQDAMLEQAIYDGVTKGEIKNADDLDQLTRKVSDRFSIWNEKHPQLNMRWITASLLYEDPFYEINYVYGSLLALHYYEMYQKDPNYFMSHYNALLPNGFDAPPSVLLKKFLNIDLNDPQILAGPIQILTEKVNLLEKEYVRAENFSSDNKLQ